MRDQNKHSKQDHNDLAVNQPIGVHKRPVHQRKEQKTEHKDDDRRHGRKRNILRNKEDQKEYK